MRDSERERAWEKRLVTVAMFLESLEEGGGVAGLEGGMVLEVRLLLNTREAGDCLVVVKASQGSERYVGFVGGGSASEALLTWKRKNRGKGLAWREDVPWSATHVGEKG